MIRNVARGTSVATHAARTSEVRVPSARRSPVLERALLAGNHALWRFSSGLIVQRQVAISQPGDPLEQEANRIADDVMRTPEPVAQRRCACRGACDDCRADEAAQIRRSPVAPAGTGGAIVGGEAPASVATVLRSPGEPLDAATRAFMEPRLGVDLGAVRIHRDQRAVESAREIDALAYTVGANVTFAAGQYAPDTSAGRRLLAHELTHVVQQTEDAPRSQELRIARQPKGGGPKASVPAKYRATETPLGGGRVRIRVTGTVGDPIPRPGLEAKYPLPQDVGLPGYDRWHLAGPNATGAEEGIAYAPKNFNVGKTAQIENMIRKARTAVREQGGDVYFDFTAEVRVTGEHEGVQVRLLEKVTWKVGVRPAGTDKVISVVNETATLPPVPKVPSPAAGKPPRPPVEPPPVKGTVAAPEAPPLVERPTTPIPEAKPGPPPERITPPQPRGGKWSGTATGLLGFALPLVMGWVHAGAVEKRIEQKAGKEGYVPFGAPSGQGLVYDIGAWFLDPANDADRAVGIDKRFNFPVWRARVRALANSKKPGETLRMSWDIGKCAQDILGRQVVEEREVVYRKQPDGQWVVESGNAAGTPSLNSIVGSDASDSTLQSWIMADPCLA